MSPLVSSVIIRTNRYASSTKIPENSEIPVRAKSVTLTPLDWMQLDPSASSKHVGTFLQAMLICPKLLHQLCICRDVAVSSEALPV
jgi:hypothetical protein